MADGAGGGGLVDKAVRHEVGAEEGGVWLLGEIEEDRDMDELVGVDLDVSCALQVVDLGECVAHTKDLTRNTMRPQRHNILNASIYLWA